ncbi:M15 family metallopeptidase [Echinicola marina]|uniref:M15 family metallopeptidase n=1 Tax=Echinicola marina TaxID=2859768 RepID=UPI001CF6F3B7|nr:M15 family metallopeptidase [Echinicola marina]UCS95141.1 M15 family metallopeptidase [Echinicola marina]
MLYRFFVLGFLWGAFSCKPGGNGEGSGAEYFLEGENKTIVIADESKADSISDFEQGLIDAGLVNVKSVLPEVLVELKYSTTDNFFGRDVYGALTNCYLQKETVEKLKLSLDYLKANYPELIFLIYDGVRPRSVQQILWDNLDKPDSIKPLYVANPQKGSLHNYGVAIDLTLAYRATGEALDLGTHYDFFGYPAYPDREAEMLAAGKINTDHIERRRVLRQAMKKGGFTGIGSEWWHFNAFSLDEAKSKFEIVP